MNQTKIYIGILLLIISTTKLQSADKTDDFIFKIHPSNSSELYIDIRGVPDSAKNIGSAVQLNKMNYGTDRFIKIIPCPKSPQYVYLQPMHSDNIIGLNHSSGSLELMENKPIEDRMFELVPVMGKKETYTIRICNTYLDADIKPEGLLKIENSDKANHTEWIFEASRPLTEETDNIMDNTNDIYRLRPANNPYLSIDLPGFNSYAGRHMAKVKLYQEESPLGADRYIKIKQCPDDPEYIFIQPQHSDFVFDVKGGSKDKGTKIQLYNEGLTNSAQMFKPILISNNGKNKYVLESKVSGLYLTSNGSGMSITQEEYTGNDDQLWIFEKTSIYNMAPPDNKVFIIQNMGNRKYLSLPKNKKDNSTKLRVDLRNPEYMADGYHKLNGNGKWKTIRPVVHSKRVLDVRRGSKKSGANIILYDRHNGNNQKFKFIPTGEAMTFYIINKSSNMALSYNYRNELIQTYFDRNDSRQKWKLHHPPF